MGVLAHNPFSLVLRSSSPFRNGSTSDRLSHLRMGYARISARNPHLTHPYSFPKPSESVSEGEQNWRGDTVLRSAPLFPMSWNGAWRFIAF